MGYIKTSYQCGSYLKEDIRKVLVFISWMGDSEGCLHAHCRESSRKEEEDWRSNTFEMIGSGEIRTQMEDWCWRKPWISEWAVEAGERSMCVGRLLLGKMRDPNSWISFSQSRWAEVLSQMKWRGTKGIGDSQNNGKMYKSLDNGGGASYQRKGVGGITGDVESTKGYPAYF